MNLNLNYIHNKQLSDWKIVAGTSVLSGHGVNTKGTHPLEMTLRATFRQNFLASKVKLFLCHLFQLSEERKLQPLKLSGLEGWTPHSSFDISRGEDCALYRTLSIVLFEIKRSSIFYINIVSLKVIGNTKYLKIKTFFTNLIVNNAYVHNFRENFV